MSEQAEWGGRIVEWARRFHVEYEYQAKRFGWKSQTPVDFDDLPEANRQTMLNTVAAVMGSEVYPRERLIEAVTAERDALKEGLAKNGCSFLHISPKEIYDTADAKAELSELRARVERVTPDHLRELYRVLVVKWRDAGGYSMTSTLFMKFGAEELIAAILSEPVKGEKS